MYQDDATRGMNVGTACDAEHPAMAVFREYCKVKSEFDQACQAVATGNQRKATAEKRLAELSAKIQGVVEDGQHDPTVPRAGRALPHNNGEVRF